jgi:hypothetical protein
MRSEVRDAAPALGRHRLARLFRLWKNAARRNAIRREVTVSAGEMTGEIVDRGTHPEEGGLAGEA